MWVITGESTSTTRPSGSRRPPRSSLAPLASSGLMHPMDQPARTSPSTCGSRFLSSGSLTETLAYPYSIIPLHPWLEYLSYGFLPRIL